MRLLPHRLPRAVGSRSQPGRPPAPRQRL